MTGTLAWDRRHEPKDSRAKTHSGDSKLKAFAFRGVDFNAHGSIQLSSQKTRIRRVRDLKSHTWFSLIFEFLTQILRRFEPINPQFKALKIGRSSCTERSSMHNSLKNLSWINWKQQDKKECFFHHHFSNNENANSNTKKCFSSSKCFYQKDNGTDIFKQTKLFQMPLKVVVPIESETSSSYFTFPKLWAFFYYPFYLLVVF